VLLKILLVYGGDDLVGCDSLSMHLDSAVQLTLAA
jgi:hypothetical protein